MQKSKEWARWRTFIKPTTCFECFRRNSKIFSYDDLLRIGEPELHENCGRRLEQLLAIVAGYATKLGTMGADWWLYYLNELPDYYITKAEAYEMGWNNLKGNLAEVAPNYIIFGGVYKNKKKVLPDKEGRIWYEADINYTNGYRNRQRVVFSNDGLIFVTYDHYDTFIEVIGEDSSMRKIVLDFTGAKTWVDIYDVMKNAFAFPYEWGNNLDALYDAMSYTWRENVYVIVKGLDNVSPEWKPYMKEILEVFQDVHEETPNVTFEIIS